MMWQKKDNVMMDNLPESVKIDIFPKLPEVPKFTDKKTVDIRYCLLSPFAYAHIFWNPKISELIYEVEEPHLDENEKDITIITFGNFV